MKTAIVIRHVAFEDAGCFASLLDEQQWTVQDIDASIQDWSLIDPLQAELCLVLGGPIGAYEDVNYPFLQAEVYFLQQRLHADLPTLGICLGAQLMARALGASVYPAAVKEVGWYPLQLSDAGKDSPVRHLSAQHCNMFHWHGDTFDLPHGAQLLASTADCQNQVYRWGRYALAFQCHPEIMAQGLERWYIGHAHEINHEKISIPAMRQDVAMHGQPLLRQARLFFLEWLIECGLQVPGSVG